MKHVAPIFSRRVSAADCLRLVRYRCATALSRWSRSKAKRSAINNVSEARHIGPNALRQIKVAGYSSAHPQIRLTQCGCKVYLLGLVEVRRYHMKRQHVPLLGARFWVALCLASIFGANLGDFFAHNLGLGHVSGLPFLAVAFALILLAERYDRAAHEAYYWLAIIVICTAATNLGDLFAGDLKWPRLWVMSGLIVLLATTIALIRQRRLQMGIDRTHASLDANALYWAGMLLAGTLGTVMGDYVSHNLRLGDLYASVALGLPLALLFVIGSRGAIWSLPFFWLTVVMVRADGTVVGDYCAGRHMLGLPLSTVASGTIFVALLVIWRDFRRRPATA